MMFVVDKLIKTALAFASLMCKIMDNGFTWVLSIGYGVCINSGIMMGVHWRVICSGYMNI